MTAPPTVRFNAVRKHQVGPPAVHVANIRQSMRQTQAAVQHNGPDHLGLWLSQHRSTEGFLF